MNSNTRHLAIALGLAAVSWYLVPARAAVIAQSRAVVDGYRVVNVYPHDADAYTQGLIHRDGFLFESTGLNGRSTVRKVKLETGEVVLQHRVNPAHFAEGLTEWNGQLVQLTWQSNIAFVYDLVSLAPRQTLNFSGEGWGLTHDQQSFILSDGTEYLRFLARGTFREIRRVMVTDEGVPVRDLNELEYVRGEVYANVCRRTESRGFRPNRVESPDGSTCEVSCRRCTNSTLRLCLTGLRMTPPRGGCSSQASSGQSSSRSRSYLGMRANNTPGQSG
jgi:glutamine cyclotransferase